MHFDQETYNALSEADRAELALWESLFESNGYPLLLTLLEGQLEAAEAVLRNAPSWDAYQYHRGCRDATAVLLNLRAQVEYKVEEKLAEKQEALDEIPFEEFT